MEIPLLSKFGSKIKNGLFKLIFETNSIDNWMVIFNFFNYCFSLEKSSNSSMWNSVFIFFVLEQKYYFWKNLSDIIKSVIDFCLI